MAGTGAKIIFMLFIVNTQGSKKPVVRDGSSWSTMKTAVKHGTEYRRGGKDGMGSMHRIDAADAADAGTLEDLDSTQLREKDTADATDAENLDDLDSTQLKEKVKLQHAKLQEKNSHIAELQSALVKAQKTLKETEAMIKKTDSALQLDDSDRPRPKFEDETEERIRRTIHNKRGKGSLHKKMTKKRKTKCPPCKCDPEQDCEDHKAEVLNAIAKAAETLDSVTDLFPDE